MDTLELCFKLKDAGYQAEAAADPEAWNTQIESWPNFNDGYRWEEHPTKGWYPNPGRKALMAEIVKLIGQEAFDAKYGQGEMIHTSLSHEGWMQAWLDTKAAQTTTTNDKPNQVAEGTGPVRNLLALKFNIKSTGSKELSGGVLVSDGRTAEALYQALTVKAMQDYTGLKSIDVYELFAVSVEMVKEELYPHEEPISKKNPRASKSPDVDDATGAETPKRGRGRPKRESGKTVAPVISQ